MMRVAFALVAVACACGRSPSPSKAPPPDQGAPPVPEPVPATATATSDELPNARVRLRLHSRGPVVGERTIEQTIWLRGARFRVRDEAGRHLSEILADVTAPAGLGDAPRTMEEIMDRKAAARRPPTGPTEIYGDLADDTAWIYRRNDKPWSKPARELVPIARQPLADRRTDGLAAGATSTVLGRSATEYRGELEVTEEGNTRKNAVRRVAAPPFLMVDDVRDAGNPGHFYVREVIELELDVVTDADVTRP
jgi:hypothetical protein